MAPVQKRTLDDTDINPELSARWLRHAHASRVLDIFRAVSMGGAPPDSRVSADAQHMHWRKPLRFGRLEN